MILNDFNKRFESIKQFKILDLTILDTRLKNLYFKDPITTAKYLRFINNLIKAKEQTSYASSTSSDSKIREKVSGSLFSKQQSST